MLLLDYSMVLWIVARNWTKRFSPALLQGKLLTRGASPLMTLKGFTFINRNPDPQEALRLVFLQEDKEWKKSKSSGACWKPKVTGICQ